MLSTVPPWKAHTIMWPGVSLGSCRKLRICSLAAASEVVPLMPNSVEMMVLSEYKVRWGWMGRWLASWQGSSRVVVRGGGPGFDASPILCPRNPYRAVVPGLRGTSVTSDRALVFSVVIVVCGWALYVVLLMLCSMMSAAVSWVCIGRCRSGTWSVLWPCSPLAVG